MNIILMGPQGSGKGTQARKIAQKYNLNHISTGELYRQAVQKKDPEILKIKEHVDKGNLMPDKQAIKMIKTHIKENNIFDGYPRTLPQAEALDEMTEVNLVIELTIPDEISIKRISNRRQCSKCGKIYTAETKKCECGTQLTQREDDKPEAITKRLQKYHDETEPLLEYYRPRHIVHTVDATADIEEVFEKTCEIIEKNSV